MTNDSEVLEHAAKLAERQRDFETAKRLREMARSAFARAQPQTVSERALAQALYEVECYGIGATSDVNKRVILEAAKALHALTQQPVVKDHHTKLLPCPHCGGKADFNNDGDRWHQVICGSCGCRGCEYPDDRSKAAAAWNRRNPSAPPVEGYGFNGCMSVAAEALEYLADHERPIGGEQKYNAEHLINIATDLRITSVAISSAADAHKKYR